MSRRPGRHGTQRDYPRTARLSQLFREIISDSLGALDDDRLDQVTITTVLVEPDLRHAIVLYDSLSGEAGDGDVLEAFAEYRWKLQGAIGRQARTKRVPELSFEPDPAVREGERIDGLLRAADRVHDTGNRGDSEQPEQPEQPEHPGQPEARGAADQPSRT